MTTGTDIIDRILDAYLLALGGVDQCPESAQPEVKSQLIANVERAERAFSDAAGDGLGGDCSHLVPITRLLFAANCASRQSLRDAAPIARLAYELKLSTGLAADIVAQRIKQPMHSQGDESPMASTRQDS
jgi:hypothetical protein